MSRTLTAATLAELSKGHVDVALFVEAEFASGTVRFWSGMGDISWNGVTWTGAGALLSVQPAAEVSDITAQGAVISLTGVDQAVISLALSDRRQGKPVRCWVAFLDSADPPQVIADPASLFDGRMDVMLIKPGAEFATVTIKAESRMRDLLRASNRRWTHEDQQIRFPGDLGFEHIAKLQQWDGTWGDAPPGSVDYGDNGTSDGTAPGEVGDTYPTRPETETTGFV